MAYQKAKRERIWAKIMLAGPSGSGKTYSALRLAKGIADAAGGRIAAIDTENGRLRYYAGEFDFDDDEGFCAPYTPEKYVQAIDDAEAAGYKVLIIDSISHEWDYCLTTHSKMPGNSYTNWGKITPRHDAFIEKILQSPIHIIATTRGKDEYVLEERNGKQVPKKVGLGYRQRDGVEYNYTVTFNLDQNTHIADVTKDNTHLFEGRYEVLTERDGAAIYAWANDGEAPQARPQKQPEREPDGEILAKRIQDILDLAKQKIDAGTDKELIYELIAAHNGGRKNPNSIQSAEVAEALYQELKKLEEKL